MQSEATSWQNARRIDVHNPVGRMLLDEDGAFRYPGLYLESSRADIGSFPEPVAAERMVLGTGAPLKHLRPALLKLEIADLKPSSRERIGWTNGRRLLGMAEDII